MGSIGHQPRQWGQWGQQDVLLHAAAVPHLHRGAAGRGPPELPLRARDAQGAAAGRGALPRPPPRRGAAGGRGAGRGGIFPPPAQRGGLRPARLAATQIRWAGLC